MNMTATRQMPVIPTFVGLCGLKIQQTTKVLNSDFEMFSLCLFSWIAKSMQLRSRKTSIR